MEATIQLGFRVSVDPHPEIMAIRDNKGLGSYCIIPLLQGGGSS